VLIVALLIMAVIALALTSYLNLNLGSARLAKRGFQQAAAFNLAEAGGEEALWSFNRANAGQADAWSGWNLAGSTARRAFTGFDFGGNTTGSIKVHVDNIAANAARPTLVALATVSAPGEAPVNKMLEITLRRRSRFSVGLMARDTITFSGNNTSVDSWNSDPDNDPATAAVPYGAGVRNDRGSVASVAANNSAVLVNQANIWGYVYTGGGAPEVGANGSITGRDTAAGVQVDPARVTTDFSADFPAIAAPVDGTPILALGATLGTAGEATKWRLNSFALRANQTLTILGDVTLVLTAGSGASAIDVTGNASIIVPDGSTLTVYTEGNILIAGNGLANANARPGSFQLYGTNTSAAGQTFQIAGNGALKAAVYAPNAEIRVNGNGDVLGAFTGRTLRFTGNAAFHYDESLANVDAGMAYGVAGWREITDAAGLAARATKFSGWCRPPPPDPKKPAAGGRAGRKGAESAGRPYFLAVKMYFATCDLWCEAVLRWMTWLLTALSRAEL